MIKTSVFLWGIFFTVIAGANTPDITEMTPEERELTGINKLNENELDALAAWLRSEQLKINRAIRDRQAGFENRRSGGDPKSIRARLVDTYNDKLGDTFYELDNGQIWKRASTGSIFIKKGGPQAVTIEPGMFGSWQLKGDGNRSVKVKRIK